MNLHDQQIALMLRGAQRHVDRILRDIDERHDEARYRAIHADLAAVSAALARVITKIGSL